MGNLPAARYKTDKRLWFLISLLLFAVPWFISKPDCVRGDFKPASLFFELRNPPVDTSSTLHLIGGFALSFGIRALAYGWVLHCVIVIIQEKRRKKMRQIEVRPPADAGPKADGELLKKLPAYGRLSHADQTLHYDRERPANAGERSQIEAFLHHGVPDS